MCEARSKLEGVDLVGAMRFRTVVRRVRPTGSTNTGIMASMASGVRKGVAGRGLSETRVVDCRLLS